MSTPIFKSSLAIAGLVLGLAACSVKENPTPKFDSDTDLVEQSTALASPPEADVIQLLLDEASRVQRALVLVTRQLPKSEEITEGCITYFPPKSGHQLVVGFTCDGSEERRDGERISRAIRGKEVVRSIGASMEYGGVTSVRRYRSSTPGKTLRRAQANRRFTFKLAKSVAKTTFQSERPSGVAVAESWTANITGDWTVDVSKPLALVPDASLSLDFTGEDRRELNISLKALSEIGFEPAKNNRCLRPIGKFEMKLTTTSFDASGVAQTATATAALITTPEGFKLETARDLVPWPTGCLENVPK